MSLEVRCQRLQKVLETGEGANVTFNVDSQQISAHKEILAIFSPVFQFIFTLFSQIFFFFS